MAVLNKAKLNYLSFEKSDIDDKSLEAIKSLHVKHLRISECKSIPQTALPLIAEFPDLARLELYQPGWSQLHCKKVIDAARKNRKEKIILYMTTKEFLEVKDDGKRTQQTLE